jgi:hypothetical protein
MGNTTNVSNIGGIYPDDTQVEVTIGGGNTLVSSGDYDVFNDPNKRLADRLDQAVEAIGTSGGTIKILAGDYDLTRDVFIPSNIVLEGQGASTLVHTGDDTIFIGRDDGQFLSNPLDTFPLPAGLHRYFVLDDNAASPDVYESVSMTTVAKYKIITQSPDEEDTDSHSVDTIIPFDWDGARSLGFNRSVQATIDCGSHVLDPNSVANPFSIEAWVRPWSSTANSTIAGRREDGGAGIDFRTQAGGGLRLVYEDDAGDQMAVSTTTDIQDDRWHHVVATYDGSDDASGMQIYVDGFPAPMTIQLNDNLGTISVGGGINMWIGSRNGTGRFIGARMTDVAFWTVALSAEDVRERYNLYQPFIENTTVRNITFESNADTPSVSVGSPPGGFQSPYSVQPSIANNTIVTENRFETNQISPTPGFILDISLDQSYNASVNGNISEVPEDNSGLV